MKRIAILALALTSTLGFAQSRSSFLSVSQITGVTVTQFNGGLSYTVEIGATPQFIYNNVAYNISEIFGFWALKDANPDTLNPSNSSFGIWTANTSTGGAGEIAGWKTNPNTGLTAGQSQTFTFAALNSAAIDRYGFHARLASGTFPGTSGNTGHITGELVPEPASMAVLSLGFVALIRKRRK
jgi:hypothetical protein